MANGRFASESVGDKHCIEDLFHIFSVTIGGSDGKEFACNVRNLGMIPGLGRSPGKATHSNILAWRIPMEGSLTGYSLWGLKELDTTE